MSSRFDVVFNVFLVVTLFVLFTFLPHRRTNEVYQEAVKVGG